MNPPFTVYRGNDPHVVVCYSHEDSAAVYEDISLNHEEVSDAISASPIEHVFCGHYHNLVDKVCKGFQLHLTLSPAFQVDLHSREFNMEAFEPVVRVINADDDSIQTRVVAV